MTSKRPEELDLTCLNGVTGGAPSTKPEDWLPFPTTPPLPAPVDDLGAPPSPLGSLPAL